MAEPMAPELLAADEEAQFEFWHTLAMRPITSNNEAFHGLILFIAEQDEADDYEGRVAWLRERDMLPRGFDRPADEAVQRGTVAVVLARYLKLRGGVAMHLLGPTPRYATRELEYMHLIPPSSPNQTLSGTQFAGILGRIEDYSRVAHPVDAPVLDAVSAQQQEQDQEEDGGESFEE
ncbi:MAG: hypothetical protein CMJ18_15465 [Phycisphaeraceae bacterium]|nr:hypothetical protein [Phycisphaeraceae bacterium]